MSPYTITSPCQQQHSSSSHCCNSILNQHLACYICRNAPRDSCLTTVWTLDMQLFVSSVLIHSSPTVIIVLFVAMPYLLPSVFSTRQPTVFPGTCVFHTCLFHQCELLTLCDPIWHVSFPYRWRAKLMLNCYTLFTLLTWVFSTCIFQPCEMSRFVLTFFILAFSNISASPFCHCATQRCVV